MNAIAGSNQIPSYRGIRGGHPPSRAPTLGWNTTTSPCGTGTLARDLTRTMTFPLVALLGQPSRSYSHPQRDCPYCVGSRGRAAHHFIDLFALLRWCDQFELNWEYFSRGELVPLRLFRLCPSLGYSEGKRQFNGLAAVVAKDERQLKGGAGGYRNLRKLSLWNGHQVVCTSKAFIEDPRTS